MWCAGSPSTAVDLLIDDVPASHLLACVGERSPLKEWQVHRVIERIRSLIHWRHSPDDPMSEYVWILLGGGEYELAYRSHCPDRYREHGDFWLTTVRTIIHDTEDGDEAELSLGLAIDMLWPCHRMFVENLRIVLEAIGGKLHPEVPFAACGRNIGLLPICRRMEIVANTLDVFCGARESDAGLDEESLGLLGEPTEEKLWLAASLAKTIRLQLDPPAGVRALSALVGPEWIRQ
jgi:hypothetical protein